jgi:uncharacterized protein
MLLTLRLLFFSLMYSLITLSTVIAGDIDQLRAKAAAGDAVSQYLLAVSYDSGQGVSDDFQQAAIWYRKSADQGLAAARNNLGVLYQLGQGVTKDYGEALNLYRLAASQGFALAQFNVGLMYAEGLGVNRNYDEACRWYQLAAGQGSVAAMSKLEQLPLKMAPAETASGILPDTAVRDNQLNNTTVGGSVEALTKLGVMYRNGQGVPQDYQKAISSFQLAARQGYAPAQNELGTIYFNGEGVTTNYAEALRWFRPAAEQGYALAQNNLGVLYQQGLGGLARDCQKASVWYRLAADQGLRGAERNLGLLYFNGQGVAKNNREAQRLLSLAAAQGDVTAEELLSKVVKANLAAR